MNTVKYNNQENLLKTKHFLETYLGKKNKEIEQNVFLSIYFSKEFRGDREALIRKKLKEAELAVRAQVSHREADKILEQLHSINPKDLIRANMSTALYITTDFNGHLFIPFPVIESVIVARSLHLKPVLNWINKEDQFWLITLSGKMCRLLKGDAFSLSEVARVVLTKPEEQKTVEKKEREKLILMAEEKFYNYMKDDHFPIILGGVQNHHDVFEKFNRDPDLISKRIIGNLDRMSYRDLHHKSLLLLDEKREEEGKLILKRYNEEGPYGKVLTDLKEITIAAVQGKIQDLVIPHDKFIWGKLDRDSGKISATSMKNLAVPEDDVLDDLAEIVLSRGGDVTMCKYREMPQGIEAVAFLKT